MSESSAAKAWRAWIYVPLLLLLNLGYPSLGVFSLDLTLLQIPIAIALAHRYGRSGFWAAVVACAPLLISVHWGGGISISGHPAVFVIAVHAAWLTLHQRWLTKSGATLPRSARMVLLLVVCSVGVGLRLGTFDVQFTLSWWGTPVLYYAFFVLGVRGAGMRRWLVVAGLITLVGALLELAGRYGILSDIMMTPFLRPSWALDRPSEFLTVLYFFWMGTWLGELARQTQPPAATLARRFTLADGAALLFLGEPLWRGLMAAITGPVVTHDFEIFTRVLSPVGSYYVVPGLALLVGIGWRRGVWLAVAVVAVYYSLSIIGAWSLGILRGFDMEYLPVTIAFAVLGARVARSLPSGESLHAQAKRAGWLVPLYPRDAPEGEVGEWQRQHDEISSTVRRVMLTLLAYALFCALTLAAPDVSLLGVSSEIKLPIANTAIDYSAFLTVGPLILVGLTVYLHLFLQSAIDLGRPDGARPLPFLFNMDNRFAMALSGFLLYWVPVLLLFEFAWKALPRPVAGFWLGLAAMGMGMGMAYLRWARSPPDAASGGPRLARVALLSFGLLFVAQLSTGGAVLNRPLRLYEAKLAKQDLSGVDLKWASLKRAKLEGTDLSRADLRGADLSGAQLDADSDLSAASLRGAVLVGIRMRGTNLAGADLQGADLTDARLEGAKLEGANLQGAVLHDAGIRGAILNGADLRGVTGLDCNRLARAQGWDQAIRDDPGLACGATVPKVGEQASNRLQRDDWNATSPWLRGERR